MKIQIQPLVIIAGVIALSIARAAASPLYSAAPSVAAPTAAAPTTVQSRELAADVTTQSQQPPSDSQVQSQPQAPLGSAQLSIEDQLDLVTTSIWHGGVAFWNFTPNVFITSTLAASKPTDGTDNRYQDAELLTQNGGMLNLLFSYSSINVGNFGKLPSSSTGSNSLVGRDDFSDRIYINPIEKIINENKAECYIINGIGLRMLNRNLSGSSSSTTNVQGSTNASNYGLGAVGYIGFGVDGALIPVGPSTASGNYRAEVFLQGSWSDSVSMKALYPSVSHLNDLVPSLGANFQVVITKTLNVNVQAGRSLGSSSKYIDKVLLIGLTLSR